MVSSSHAYIWFVVSGLLFSLVCGCTQAKEKTEYGSELDQAPITLVVVTPSAPPDLPPNALLSVNQGKEQQMGLLVYHNDDWNGVPDEFSMSLPVEWPAPLPAGRNEKVVLDLRTPIMPANVDVRWFTKVRPNGEPAHPPNELACSLLGRTTDTCDLDLPADRREDSHWTLGIPMPPESGTYYLSVQGTWIDTLTLPEGRTDSTIYLSTWLFTVARN